MSTLLIDVSSVVCRGYFREQSDVRKASGNPKAEPSITRTTARFCAMIDRLVSDHHPTHGAAALEGHGLTWRHREHFEYKAKRSPKPEPLTALLGAVPDLLRAMGFPTIRVDGYEADDVIASLITQHTGVILVSPDKDFFALWGKNGSRQYDPLRRRADLPPDAYPGDWVTARDVFEKFGVDPVRDASPGPGREPAERCIEVQALMGDAVDGVSGCPGVGDKTAIALIQAFGTVEAVYAALRAPPPAGGKLALPEACRKFAGKLEAGYADVRMSHRLVSLVTDLDVRAERMRPRDGQLCEELARRYGWTAEEAVPAVAQGTAGQAEETAPAAAQGTAAQEPATAPAEETVPATTAPAGQMPAQAPADEWTW